MKQRDYWRGVEGIDFLWHGEWADPELRYGNIVANGAEVEMDLQAVACEEIDADDSCFEEKFTMWCREHRNDVIESIYLHQTYDSRRYNFFDALDGGTVTYADPILIDGMFVCEVRLDDECRMWIRTIDSEERELEQTSTFDKRSREFVRYYGDFETEATLIDAHHEQVYGEWRHSAD